MADPGTNFGEYMQALEQQQVDAERRRAMLEAHEHWRQTTWAGWSVRMLQATGKRMVPVLEAIGNATSSNGRSLWLSVLIRLVAIGAAIAIVYGMAQFLNVFLNREIVIEQQVIVEVDDEDDDEPRVDYPPAEETTPRRSARGKTKKTQ